MSSVPRPGHRSRLHRRQLFPHDIGVRRCAIQAGTLGLPTIYARCGVRLAHVWSNPQVTFTEEWPAGRHVHRHHWHVTIRGSIPRLTSQDGSMSPQFSI